MDSSPLFPTLPDDARVWIYVANRPLTADEQEDLQAHLEDFIEDWSSHGRPVDGAVDVLHKRFIVLVATLTEGDISGCGIDASVHAIEDVAQQLNIEWVPTLDIVYRDADGHVQHCSRATFRALAEEETVTAETPVFDPSITTLGALRDGQFEQPAGASWHARAFDLAQPA